MNAKDNKILIFLFLLLYIKLGLLPTTLTFREKINLSDKTRIYKIQIYKNEIFAKADHSVVVFNLRGVKKREFGRKGEGPGDFDLLSDFFVSQDKVYAVDSYRKINCFNLKGDLTQVIKLKNKMIRKILPLNSNIFYVYDKWKISSDGKKATIFKNISDNDRDFLSIKDESKINAYNPQKKNIFFPWFPAPFYNRMICVRLYLNRIGIFFTRENYFYIFENKSLSKTLYRFNFKVQPITAYDKSNFFKAVDTGSKMKWPQKTKKSINFPREKEFFVGAIKWNENIALIGYQCLFIISENGELLKTIKYPNNRVYGAMADFGGYPEDLIFKRDKLIFYLNEDYDINVYELN